MGTRTRGATAITRPGRAPADWDGVVPECRNTAVLGRAPHLYDPSTALAVWYTEPLGMVTEMARGAPIDGATAEFVMRVAYPFVSKRLPKGAKAVVVHDWLRATGQQGLMRADFVRWGSEIAQELSLVVLALPEHRAISLSASVAQAGLAAVGIRLELTPSTLMAIGKYQLRALPQHVSIEGGASRGPIG